MPGMGGRELAERVLAGRPQMRVLYISGYTAASPDGSAEATGWPMVPKPFRSRELVRQVRRVLDEGR